MISTGKKNGISHIFMLNNLHTLFLFSWTENEIRSAEFPFEIEKPFKIAFGFTEENLKVAVNGSSLMEFNLDNILVEEDETVWDILSGFRIKNREEETSTMIVGIEHYRMDNNCDGFEKHSSME